MTRRFALPALVGLGFATTAGADQVIADDLIVTGKICVGSFECMAGENFGDADIRIRSSVPEVQFFDSTSGDTSWTLSVDDLQSGVNNSFTLKNESLFHYPLVVQENAPDKALFIDNNGMIGLQTSIPQANLHIVDTGALFEAAIRLEDTTGTHYTWDLRANDAGFYLYDYVANKLPFQVRPGAPSSSIEIVSSGAVGMGTDSPDAALHVRRSDNTAALLIEETGPGTLGQLTLRNNGITFFTLEDASIADVDYSGRKWNFQNQNGTFRVTTPPGGPGEIEMLLEPVNGNMTIRGELFTGGSCAAGCDRVFDADYPLPSIDEQMAAIRDNGHLPNVGPTDEDGPYNLSAMSTGMLNELEKAHLYIGQLHEELAQLRGKVAHMDALEARLDALEADTD